jgi:DNA-binding beta-propeller fold protein YncE
VVARKEIKRIPVGAVPVGILIEPDGGQAWVACTAADLVARFDLKTLEAAGQVQAGRQPDGLAWVGK